MLQMEINGVMVDVVLKDTHLDRMNAKQVKLEGLQIELDKYTADGVDWKAKATTLQGKFDTLTGEHTTLQGDFDTHKSNASTAKVLSDGGVTDSYHQSQVLNRYKEVAADGVELKDWLSKDAKTDGYIGHVFSSGASGNTDDKGKPPKSNINGDGKEKTAVTITPEQYASMSEADQLKNGPAFLEGQGFAMPKKTV